MLKEPIEKIRKRFKNEWLLIAVDEVDPQTRAPLKGHLVAHSASRREIWKRSRALKEVAYVVHSDEWPDDLAACFFQR